MFRPRWRKVVAQIRDMTCTRRAHNTHAILGHAATPPHNKLGLNLTECFNTNVTLSRLNFKLPDDGRRPKHVGKHLILM